MNTQSVNHHKLINNIKESQKKEMQLILDLQKLPDDNDSLVTQRKILEEMVQNANLRMNEFRQLQALYNVLVRIDKNAAAEIKDQMSQLELVNRTLQQDKDKIAINRNINIGNLRKSEINTYYSNKYSAQAGVLLYVIYLFIPILLLAVLRSRDIITSNVLYTSITLLIVIALFFIVPKILDIRSRNNMVFSEYDFPSNMKNIDWGSGDDVKEESTSDMSIYCVGPACCTAGMIYDNKRELCVIKDNFNESFLSGQSTSQNSELIGSKI